MCLAMAREQKNALDMLVSMPIRQSSSEISQMASAPLPRTMPALFNRMSTLPYSSRARSISAATCDVSVTSVDTVIARRPISRAACATSSIGPIRRDAITRSAPAEAIARVISRPKPVPPPVMTMVLPSRESFSSSIGPPKKICKLRIEAAVSQKMVFAANRS